MNDIRRINLMVAWHQLPWGSSTPENTAPCFLVLCDTPFFTQHARGNSWIGILITQRDTHANSYVRFTQTQFLEINTHELGCNISWETFYFFSNYYWYSICVYDIVGGHFALQFWALGRQNTRAVSPHIIHFKTWHDKLKYTYND